MAPPQSVDYKAALQKIAQKRVLDTSDLDALADMMLKGQLSAEEASKVVEGKNVHFHQKKAENRVYRIVEEGSVLKICEKNGDTVGDLSYSTQYGPEGEVLFVNEIFIQPDKRRRGYGSALMDYVTKIAKKRRLKSILLEVDQANQKAFEFFQYHGFREIGATNEGNIDRITLIKNLR